MSKFPKKYDLEERTTKFGENIQDLCWKVKINYLTTNTVKQLLRSGTGVGANYTEANNASSKKDFRNKIFICKKEAQETQYWLRMLAKGSQENYEDIKILLGECHELILIFQKIVNSLNHRV